MDKKTSEQTDIEWIKSSLERIEIRLQSLEAFKWKMIGISSVVIFVLETLVHAK